MSRFYQFEQLCYPNPTFTPQWLQCNHVGIIQGHFYHNSSTDTTNTLDNYGTTPIIIPWKFIICNNSFRSNSGKWQQARNISCPQPQDEIQHSQLQITTFPLKNSNIVIVHNKCHLYTRVTTRTQRPSPTSILDLNIDKSTSIDDSLQMQNTPWDPLKHATPLQETKTTLHCCIKDTTINALKQTTMYQQQISNPSMHHLYSLNIIFSPKQIKVL